MFLVKIGGSVITVKSRYRVFRQKAVTNLLLNLQKTGTPFALVHGGGSFGHIKAKEYGLPGSVNARTLEGYSVVHRDMVDLDQRVVRTLNDLGINAIGIPPALFLDGTGGLVDTFEDYMTMGFAPVTFGDVHIDGANISIISGDDLVRDIAGKLKPEKVIFFTDTDGIYDMNPKIYRHARLLKNIEQEVRYEHVGTDVTGGMEKKVQSIREITRLGVRVYVLNGNKPERIHDIDTERFIGTVIE